MKGFAQIDPIRLNARQKENYNFLKISAVLADYGFMTMRLSSDWQGADFIAQHIDGQNFLKIQLKSRLGFNKKYSGKDIYVAFPDGIDWYIYPHDEFLQYVLLNANIKRTKSWSIVGEYTFPKINKKLKLLLQSYLIGSTADRPMPATGGSP